MIKNGAGKVPDLLAVLTLIPDPCRPRGRRYVLVFVLAVAAACMLAGVRTFREIGDQARWPASARAAGPGRAASPAAAEGHRPE